MLRPPTLWTATAALLAAFLLLLSGVVAFPRPTAGLEGRQVSLEPSMTPLCMVFGEDSTRRAYGDRDTVMLLAERTWDGAHEAWYRVTGPQLFRFSSFAWRPISGDSIEMRHYDGHPVRVSRRSAAGHHVVPDRVTLLGYLAEGGAAGAVAGQVVGRRIPCDWHRSGTS